MGRGSKSQAAAGVQLFSGADLRSCLSATVVLGIVFVTGVILLVMGLDQKPSNAGTSLKKTVFSKIISI